MMRDFSDALIDDIVIDETPFNEDKFNEYKDRVNKEVLENLSTKYPDFKIDVIPLQSVDAGRGDFDVNIDVEANGEVGTMSSFRLGLIDPIELADEVSKVAEKRIEILDKLTELGVDLSEIDGYAAVSDMDFPSNINDANKYLTKLLIEAE